MPVARISKEEMKRRLDAAPGERPVLLDVRLKYPYDHSTVTLPGAIRMPPGALDRTRLPDNRDIVVYDSDPDEFVAERVADELNKLGYRACALAGGIAEWVGARFPTETKAPRRDSPSSPGVLGS